MRWDVLPAAQERVSLAQELVSLSPAEGWSAATLAKAAQRLWKNEEAWRRVFPGGPREALWFVSEVSDESMRAAFLLEPAASMAVVINERLAQNRKLKPFVRTVMAFDLRNPVQAVKRMQRTARVMQLCVASHIGGPKLILLNQFYTLIVFFWLFDRSPDDAKTSRLARTLMWILRL